MATKKHMIERIVEAAQTDEGFLWNSFCDIQEVFDMKIPELERKKKNELIKLYKEAEETMKEWEGKADA